MTRAVTLRGGDRFQIRAAPSALPGGLWSVRRARKMPDGKWSTVNLVIRPKQDLQWGVIKSMRHYRQAMGDSLTFQETFAVPKVELKVGALERKGVQLSEPPVVVATKRRGK